MKCPHCLVSIHSDFDINRINEDRDGLWYTKTYFCPSCKRNIIYIVNGDLKYDGGANLLDDETKIEYLVYPKGSSRNPVPKEVDHHIAEDYTQACLVLADSPKASAALSRRCLQNLLKEKASVTKRDLADQIQEILDTNNLPSHIAENIDTIRNIGNYAAHPNKSKSTGEILAVEPHEAEWNLEVLEQLFDFYYVQPAIAKAKRDALNLKLADAGKPRIKGS